MSKTFAFIFARGGSVGVPQKNIRPFNGKPLIFYSISIAAQMEEIDEIFVSTDDSEIAEIATSFGVTIIERPAELAQNDSREWLAWQHAIQHLNKSGIEFSRFVSLPATCPLRTTDDVRQCLNALDDSTDIVVTMQESKRSPWYNMVCELNGYIHILMESNTPVHNRQEAAQSYDLTTLAYISTPAYILSASNIFDGRVKGVIIPEERAIDIDTQLDFEIAEFIMRKSQDPLC